MKVILTLVLSLLASGVRSAEGPEAVAPAYNRFGFDLLSRVRQNGATPNVFLSPPGLAFALSMVQNGARGETLRQMAMILQVTNFAPDDLNTANKALLDLLNSLDPKLTLEIANGVWTDKSAVIEPEFAAVNKSDYNAEAFSADFKDPALVKTINDWVSDHTDGKIPKMLQGPMDPMLRLIVMDAIYFKGSWLRPFDKKETHDQPFTLANGQSVQHPRMARSDEFSYFEDETSQAVDLPYAGGDVSMVVVLPKAGLDDFLRSFSAEKLQQCLSGMEIRRGTLELPRFKLEHEYDLKNVLEAMGMSLAFTPGADFSGISKERLCISWVKQKTYVEVNEEGTIAAAATGIGVRAMVARAERPPFRMVVDRPFLVAVREHKTGLILFLGSIFDPR